MATAGEPEQKMPDDKEDAKEPSEANASLEGEVIQAQEQTFTELLQMLQMQHESEIASVRENLTGQLQATQQELLDAKRCLEKVQLEAPTDQPADNKQDGQQHLSEFSQVVATDGRLLARRQSPSEPAGSEMNKIAKQLWVAEPDEIFVENEDEHEVDKEHANELALIKGWASKPDLNKYARLKWTPSKLQQKLMKFIQMNIFETVCAVAILSNAFLMGFQIDYIARHMCDPAKAPLFYRVMDRIYTVWFVCELLLKLVAYGLSFFYRPGSAWNIFDFILVSTDALQTCLEVATSGRQVANLTFLRMLRVLRVTRAIRVVRLVRFFRELRIMVASVMKSGTSLMWSMLMFCAIIYIFSILLLNSVAYYVFEHPDDRYQENFREYWSSLPEGMWTLFSCMTGGVSWMEVGKPLLHIGWVYGLILGFFMFFTIFVVTNIITGIFVDTAIQNAQSDRDEVIQEELHSRDNARFQLKQVFQEADHDNSGTLTMEEFEEHMGDERVKAHLESIGLQVTEARGLFRLLDIHDKHVIKIEEFLFGCMRLKGGATSIDLATLMYENKRLALAFRRFSKDVHTALRSLNEKLDSELGILMRKAANNSTSNAKLITI